MLLVYIVTLSITGNLAVNGQLYGPWSDWSECSVDEGQGVMSRRRSCIVDDCPPSGEYLDFMACFVKPCKCECPPFPAEPGTEEPTTVSTGTIKIELSEEPTTAAPEATTAAVSTGTIKIGLIEESTTAAPEITTTSASEISTTSAPETNATSGPEISTTGAPELTSTSAPEENNTNAPEMSTTSAPELTSTSAPEETSTSAPEMNATSAPEMSSTSAPEESSTSAPEETSTTAPEITTTSAPEESSSSAPATSTSGPEITTTSAPETNATSVPEISTTSAPEISTTSEETSTGTIQVVTNAPVTEKTEAAIGKIGPTTETPEEIPCEENALGAATGGKLPSSSFTASSSFAEFEPSFGRLNGPLAWCSQGDSAGQEYLQIHVPEAEAICAVAIQGNGFNKGDEHVRDYYIEYSEDGIHWEVFEEDGNLKVFKGNEDSKSTSKQVLPVPIEAAYVRIYPMQYEGWICMRVELYGKARTERGQFPPGAAEETTAVPTEIKTAAPPATEETTSASSEKTTAVPPVDGCNKYTVLNEADRAQEYTLQDNFRCDNNLVAGWYRFQGAAGDRMADTCVPQHRCGTWATGWLHGGHPTVSEGVVTREVCFHYSGSCCGRSTIIKVKNCGSYYLYELKKPPGCNIRYCGNGAPNEETTAAPSEETTEASGEETTAAPSEETTAAPSEETTEASGEGTTATLPGPESKAPTTVQEETSTLPPPVTPPQPTTAKRKGMDIGILIDSSFGIAADKRDLFRRREFGVSDTITFERLKSFVSELVISINEHFEDVNFGIIVYSDLPELVMTLQNVERVDVESVIDGIKYIPGNHRTDLAMLYASRKLFCPEGCDDRPDEDNVMIVFTSENTDAESLPYSFVSPIMKSCTSNVIAVGISAEVTKSELVKIALGSKERVLRVVNPNNLDSEVIFKIEEMIAEGPIIPSTQGAIVEEEEKPTTGGLVHFRT